MITFRRTQPEDAEQIAEWIAKDEPHKGIDAKFFIEGDEISSCYTVEDDHGAVVFVRQESAGRYTRLHTQFHPDQRRVVQVLIEGYPVMRADAQKRGFTSIRFESKSPALIRFMIERFGFRADLIADL